DIQLDLDAKMVVVNGISLTLTVREYTILVLLMTSPNKVFSKSNLFESVWNEPFHGDDNTVNVHMSNLRNKLSKANPNEESLERFQPIRSFDYFEYHIHIFSIEYTTIYSTFREAIFQKLPFWELTIETIWGMGYRLKS